MNNEIIEITCEDGPEYTFKCPICGKVNHIFEEEFCEHVLYIYLTEEGNAIYFKKDIYNHIFSKLRREGIEYLEPILERCFEYYEEFRESDDFEEPLDWDKVKCGIIREYMSSGCGGLNDRDFVKILSDSEYKESVQSFIKAEYHDYDGSIICYLGDV